jgi:flagellar protein FlgJ
LSISSIDDYNSLNSIQNYTIKAKTEKLEDDNFNKILSSIKQNTTDNKKTKDVKLKDACQNFESIFLNMILKDMRNTIPKDSLYDDTSAEDTFQGMLDEQYSNEMAKRGTGLADIMYKQLSRDINDK